MIKRIHGYQVEIFSGNTRIFTYASSDQVLVVVNDKMQFVEDEPDFRPAFPKPEKRKKLSSRSRHADAKLLEAVRGMNCLACKPGEQHGPCDPDHILSVGAGGRDTPQNVWALCRKHHIERHAKGLFWMATHYPKCHSWLERTGNLERIVDKQVK